MVREKPHKKLRLWQKIMDLVVAIYQSTQHEAEKAYELLTDVEMMLNGLMRSIRDQTQPRLASCVSRFAWIN